MVSKSTNRLTTKSKYGLAPDSISLKTVSHKKFAAQMSTGILVTFEIRMALASEHCEQKYGPKESICLDPTSGYSDSLCDLVRVT